MKRTSIVISAAVVFVLAVAAPALAEMLVVKGSTTVLPIAQKVVEAYMHQHPETKISLSGGGSSNGIKALIDSTTDIATSSRFIKDKEVRLAFDRGVYPVPFCIAYDSIVPIVHPSHTISNMSLAQLKAIYKGEITNFRELGGPNKRIVVVSRDTSSGTFETWEQQVMNKEKVTPRAQLLASNGAVVQAVSKNKYAIGYVGIGYLNKDVKGLTVNGIEATPESTLDGTFPISRPLFMFTNGWPKLETLNFINFVLSPNQGQKFVAESGYVPLY